MLIVSLLRRGTLWLIFNSLICYSDLWSKIWAVTAPLEYIMSGKEMEDTVKEQTGLGMSFQADKWGACNRKKKMIESSICHNLISDVVCDNLVLI